MASQKKNTPPVAMAAPSMEHKLIRQSYNDRVSLSTFSINLSNNDSSASFSIYTDTDSKENSAQGAYIHIDTNSENSAQGAYIHIDTNSENSAQSASTYIDTDSNENSAINLMQAAISEPLTIEEKAKCLEAQKAASDERAAQPITKQLRGEWPWRNFTAHIEEPEDLLSLAKKRELSKLFSDSVLRIHDQEKSGKRKKPEKTGKKNASKVDIAQRAAECGDHLEFIHIIEEDRTKLEHANFCKVRLCPVCIERASKKAFHEVKGTILEAQKMDRDLRPIFLTITVKNPDPEGLSPTYADMMKGWHRIINNKKYKKLFKGWHRAFEATYNRRKNTFHPHLHVIILVGGEYFDPNQDLYMDKAAWTAMCRKALRLDYDPIVDIRGVAFGSEKSLDKAVAEISKYTVKQSNYIFEGDKDLTDEVTAALMDALDGKRLRSYGGIMKEARKKYLAEKKEYAKEHQGEVLGEDGRVLVEDKDYVRFSYVWNYSTGCYEIGDCYSKRRAAFYNRDGDLILYHDPSTGDRPERPPEGPGPPRAGPVQMGFWDSKF